MWQIVLLTPKQWNLLLLRVVICSIKILQSIMVLETLHYKQQLQLLCYFLQTIVSNNFSWCPIRELLTISSPNTTKNNCFKSEPSVNVFQVDCSKQSFSDFRSWSSICDETIETTESLHFFSNLMNPFNSRIFGVTFTFKKL